MATFYGTITERVKIEADSYEEAQMKLFDEEYEHESWEQEVEL